MAFWVKILPICCETSYKNEIIIKSFLRNTVKACTKKAGSDIYGKMYL